MVQVYGYTVTTCTSGLEALELFEENPDCFDLVVTYQTIPWLTGIQFTKEIVKIRPDIPIITVHRI